MTPPGNPAAAGAPSARRILIILMGAIGDVVRALPLLGRLRRGYPDAHLAWAVEPLSEPLLRGHPWLDQVLVYERNHAPWSFPSFLRQVRQGRFDLVLDLQRHLKSGITAWVSAAPRRVGFAAANSKEYNYWFTSEQIEPQPPMRLKLMQYQAFAEYLGLPAAPVEFGLSAGAAEIARAQELIGELPAPLLAILLGSSWPSRDIFPEMAAETALSLHHNHGLTPLLIGGSKERELADAVMRRLGQIPAANLVGRTSLRDLLAIFPRCTAAFGPDCGPMHIAAAAGCPVVSLWGATAPERSAPWGFDELTIKAPIPCHPCYLRHCPIDRECMRRISPALVALTVERAMTAALQSA